MTASRASLKRRWNREQLQYDRAQEALVRILDMVVVDLSDLFQVRPVPFVTGRLKEFDSFCAKALEYQQAGRANTTGECFTAIKDIVRARIICQTLKDADHIRHMLDDERTPLLVLNVQTHDGGARGYRGIHIETSVDTLVGGETVTTVCEVQIQTALQFAWGLYTHKDVYKGADVPPLVAELMIELSRLLNVGDRIAGTLLEEIEASSGVAAN